MKPVKMLLVEDDKGAIFGYSAYLDKNGYTVDSADSLKRAKECVASQEYDGILLDLSLPDGNTLDWIVELRRDLPTAAIIVITGDNNIPTAVQAMKNGADNFLAKPVNLDELSVSLAKSLATGMLRKRDSAFQLLNKKDTVFFGTSTLTAKTMEYAKVAADSETTALILGETGTGKGVLARWIHDHSSRKDAAFVELNCSALKGELLRSELFGHTKGAFTSAVKDREGLIEAADGGTLFLDEIGDMDIEVQTQLLKTLEEKNFRRLGENRLRTSDFRLICATHRDLVNGDSATAFRKDLYFRISVFPIIMPPLREIPDDVPGLADHLLARLGYAHFPLSQPVAHLLTGYQWPGNIRELRNMLERATLLSKGGPLAIQHFPGLGPSAAATAATPLQGTDNGAGTHAQHAPAYSPDSSWNLDEAEKAYIRHALEFFHGDKNRVSKELGISLSSLYRRLEKAVPAANG